MLAALLLASAVTTAPATVIQRFKAEEANQGVASDGTHVYAISNAEIGKYDRDGRRVAKWTGDPALFRHMNSCAVVKQELVCAASNYPAVPHASSIEIFDTRTLVHKRSHSLGPGTGSLTVLDWHDRSWWAIFANYDGKGGEPPRDHRATTLVRMDARFRPLEAWLFPETVLARFAPKSASGAAWGDDDLFYVTGHDRPELYALRLPDAGSILEHVGTTPIATGGQAIDWDAKLPRTLWTIERSTKEVVASLVPPIPRR